MMRKLNRRNLRFAKINFDAILRPQSKGKSLALPLRRGKKQYWRSRDHQHHTP
jgi:hypothetical protein